MKKFLGIILAVVMLATVAFAADITVTLNGEVVDCESYGSPATIVEGRTLVPLRAIFEALGATVEWDPATKTVSSTRGEDSISLTVGSTTLVKNGEDVTLDVPAQIINSRTMVPARAIAEAYGVDVQWDAASRTVILTKEEKVEEDKPADGIFKFSQAYATGSDGIQYVEDPTDPSNEVMYIKSNAGENTSWNYFWYPGEFKPGERYIVSFDVYLDTDALGNEIAVEKPSVGICFSYGDFAESEDGSATHHGNTIDKKSSTVYPGVKTWTRATYIFEMPETLNEASKMDFGIYANPIDVAGYSNKIAMNFYLDDITVALYEGAAENGIQTAESIEMAEKADAFDINTAKGVVYDMDSDEDLFMFGGCSYEYKDGHLVLTAEGENQIDPTINHKNSGIFNADNYGAVAVRFKAEGVAENQQHIVVYFATVADDKLSQSKSVLMHYKDLPVDEEGYYIAYIQMVANPAWAGQLAALRVDPGNSNGYYEIDKIVVVEK